MVGEVLVEYQLVVTRQNSQLTHIGRRINSQSICQSSLVCIGQQLGPDYMRRAGAVSQAGVSLLGSQHIYLNYFVKRNKNQLQLIYWPHIG